MATAVYRWALALAIAAATLVLVAPSAGASLIGDTVSAKELAPDTATVQDDLGIATVGPGVEFVFDLALNLDFGASTLTISVEPGSVVGFFDAPFNGFGFVDLATPFGSASVDPATDVPGFTAADLTLSGGELFVNLQSLGIDGPSDEALAIDASPMTPGQRSLRFAAAVLPPFPGSIWNSTVWPSRSSGNPDC
jgi:hypothetical protein